MGESCTIGRDPRADVVLADQRVSGRHAVIRSEQGRWILEDSGSRNGTFLGDQRVGHVELEGDCVLRLGHPLRGPEVRCSISYPPAAAAIAGASPLSVDRRPTVVRSVPTGPIRIGRSAENDIVVNDLGVSRHHAELRDIGGGRYELIDLGSRNGTFVNGARAARATVTELDIVAVGNATFRIDGDQLREFVDEGDVGVAARDLTVRLSNGRAVLDGVGFSIEQRAFAAVIGPSGAGKSTLLGALTGMRPATAGSVSYDNRDLYTNYAELRQRIGLVPQENILHTQLSALQALDYAAQLRFSSDITAAERRARVDEVLEELGLSAHEHTRIGALSGGQQKRVNVALELLAKPSLLFLDEPTSGLDPGLDKSLMQLMRGLTREGRTVIVVTHSVTNIDLCDRVLVLVPGGRLAFFGPPRDGLEYFGGSDWGDVYQTFAEQPQRDWAADFKQSKHYARYVGERSDVAAGRPAVEDPAPPSLRWRYRLAQLGTLCRRYAAILAADRVFLGVLAGVPLFLGVLIRATPAKEGLAGSAHTNQDVASLLLIVVICACFAGAMNSVREIVKERAIYIRERNTGLSPAAYLSSKMIVLGLISAVQAIGMLLIGLAGRRLPPSGSLLSSVPLVELTLAIGVLAIASMALGLLISAWVGTSEKAMPFLMLAVVMQVLLSGGIFALNGKAPLQQVAWLSPSRWGFAMTASTVNLTRIEPVSTGSGPDPLWLHNGSTWLTDMIALLALTAAIGLLTWIRLVRVGSQPRG